MKKLLIFTMLVAMGGISACHKYDAAKELKPGECEISSDGYKSQGDADAERSRVSAILQNRSIGNSVLGITRQQTYASKTKRNGKPLRWAYQIVFTCDDAELYYEYDQFYDSFSAQYALDYRLDVLNSTNGIKTLDWDTGTFTYDCYTTYDPYYGDSYDYCYYGSDYNITYARIYKSQLTGNQDPVTEQKMINRKNHQEELLSAWTSVYGAALKMVGVKVTAEQSLKMVVNTPLVFNDEEKKTASDLLEIIQAVKKSPSRDLTNKKERKRSAEFQATEKAENDEVMDYFKKGGRSSVVPR